MNLETERVLEVCYEAVTESAFLAVETIRPALRKALVLEHQEHNLVLAVGEHLWGAGAYQLDRHDFRPVLAPLGVVLAFSLGKQATNEEATPRTKPKAR